MINWGKRTVQLVPLDVLLKEFNEQISGGPWVSTVYNHECSMRHCEASAVCRMFSVSPTDSYLCHSCLDMKVKGRRRRD